MKRIIIPISLALCSLYAEDKFSSITAPAIASLQAKSGIDSKTAAYVQEMVDKTLKSKLEHYKTGFFVGVEGGLNGSTLHYTIRTDGAEKRINDSNVTVDLGITAGYDHIFSNDFGLSFSGYLGKGSDIKSDVNTGYFGHISNLHLVTNYSTWKSGFETNFLYRLSDSIRLSAGLNYRYTKYNSIPDEDIRNMEVDAITRSADVVSKITDQVVSNLYYTTFCTRRAYSATGLSDRCEGIDKQSSSSSGSQSQIEKDLQDSKTQAEKAKIDLKNYIINYIEANSEKMFDGNFAQDVAKAALNYKQTLEWSYALRKSIEHDLKTKAKYSPGLKIANGKKYEPDKELEELAKNGIQDVKSLQDLYNNAFKNAIKAYDGTTFYQTIVTLEVVEKVYDYIKKNKLNLHGTAANYLPADLLRQGCGDYNAAPYFTGDKQNDCTFLMKLAREISKGWNTRDNITPQVAMETIYEMMPKIKKLAEAQLRSYSSVLGVLERKLRAMEGLRRLRKRLSDQELVSEQEISRRLHAAALAANTPGYIKPTHYATAFIDGEVSRDALDVAKKRVMTAPALDGYNIILARKLNEGKANKFTIRCKREHLPCLIPDLPFQYSITTLGDAATGNIAKYLYGNDPLPALDLQSTPLTLNQSQLAPGGSEREREKPGDMERSLVDQIKEAIKTTANSLHAATSSPASSAQPESTHKFSPQLGLSWLKGPSEFYISYKFGGLIKATSRTSTSLYDSLSRATLVKTSETSYLALGYKYHF